MGSPKAKWSSGQTMSLSVTVASTVLSGVTICVLGQIVTKLMIDPVVDLKKTIANISHSYIEHAHIIHNPGVPSEETARATSHVLITLSSQLRSYLFLIPIYNVMSSIFKLPSHVDIVKSSNRPIFLSNCVVSPAATNIHEQIVKAVDEIHDRLGIYRAQEDRWPKE